MSSTDRRTDGRTDGQTDRRTDGRTRWIQYTPLPTSLGGGITICCMIKFSSIIKGVMGNPETALPSIHPSTLPSWFWYLHISMPTIYWIDLVDAFITGLPWPSQHLVVPCGTHFIFSTMIFKMGTVGNNVFITDAFWCLDLAAIDFNLLAPGDSVWYHRN